eukprot:scaffold3754_cov36-Phaeocystis_antarctica.AAC.1
MYRPASAYAQSGAPRTVCGHLTRTRMHTSHLVALAMRSQKKRLGGGRVTRRHHLRPCDVTCVYNARR